MRGPGRRGRARGGLGIVAAALLSLGGAAAAPSADPVNRILAAAQEGHGYETLAYLSDRIGPRLSGSAGLQRAVEWTRAELERYGLDRAWTEEVMVPHWVRGEESGSILAPAAHPLALTALGGSVGTPEGGMSGEVAVFSSLEELEETGEDAVRGRIVLFDKPVLRNGGSENGYGPASRLRVRGPSAAAKLGAAAMLIRSLGTADFRLPHTGALRYAADAPRIPAAAVSAEDAELIRRLGGGGEAVRVHFTLGCRTLEDAPSANVLADWRGREQPEEIVVIGAHLDSWDLGTGAIDDGAGVAIVMETMRLLRELDLRPRRTIRAVLFTNEENGLRGGRDYAERRAAEVGAHVAAIESDSGGAAPMGFSVSAGEGGEEIVRALAERLAGIGASDVTSPGGGADIGPLRRLGVPTLGLRQDSTYYFDYHHTAADTLDKVDPEDLAKNVAAMAVMAWSLAEREEPLPRPEPAAPAE